MAVSIRPIRVANPTHKKVRPRGQAATRASGTRRQKKRNPVASLMTLGYLNPQQKGQSSMKTTTKKHKKNPHRAAPAAFAKKKKNPGRRRKNPNSRFLGSTVNTLKMGVWALIGLVITRQIPQMILGAKNTGALGYLANAATMVGSAAMFQRFAGAEAGSAVAIGGGIYTVNRALQEYLSPVGKVLSLSGIGDPMALGEIVTDGRAYFPMPVAWDGNNPVVPREIRPIPPLAMIAPSSGMGYAGRFNSRFGANAA